MEQLNLHELNHHLNKYNLQIKKENFYESIDSTFNAKGDIVIAKSQTNGTGRLNRPFFCANGGIYLCVQTKLKSLVTISAGVGVLRCLQSYNINANVKWVNDIIYKGKKLCGILAKNNKESTVVGVGLNYCVKIPRELKKIAISLKNKTLGINEFSASLIFHLLDSFNRLDNLSFYKSRVLGLNSEIILPNKTKAIFSDISLDGNLIYTQNNETKTLYHGDIIL